LSVDLTNENGVLDGVKGAYLSRIHPSILLSKHYCRYENENIMIKV